MLLKLHRLGVQDVIVIVRYLRAKVTSDHQPTRDNRGNTGLFTVALSWRRVERAKGELHITSDIYSNSELFYPIHTHLQRP